MYPLNVAVTSLPCAETNDTTPLKKLSVPGFAVVAVVAVSGSIGVAPAVWLLPVSLNHTTK